MAFNIMIVTGEASGDLHGANLLKALRPTIDSGVKFYGMGGPELEAQGVEILFDAAKISVVGIFEVITHAKDIFAAQKLLRNCIEKRRPDLLILIDLPDFNLLLAKKAKKLGIPVFYYIAPQVWAWRSSRVKVIKERVDDLGVILPFEESFFKNRGLNAKYVGHPLLDSVKTSLNKHDFKKLHKIDPSSHCVGLLPGSRKREVSSLLPVFLGAAEILQKQSLKKIVFLVPQAATISQHDLEEAGIAEFRNRLDIRVIKGDRYNLMAACDCVVAASGTVTLELAILQTPMVVTYKLSPLSYQLGRLLVKLDYFSLVNLIAGYKAVPELLQDDVTPERVAKELALLLNAYTIKREMANALLDVRLKLGGAGASQKAAALVKKLLVSGQVD